MARFVRKPRPTHQQRRSHHDHDPAEEAGVTEEEQGEEAEATEEEPAEETVTESQAAFAARVVDVDREVASAPPGGEEPAGSDVEDIPPSAPGDDGAVEPDVEAAADTTAAMIEADAELEGSGAVVTDEVGEAADVVATAAVEVDESEVDESDAGPGDADARGADAGPDGTEVDDTEGDAGAPERRTIKRRRRRRPGTTEATAFGDTEAVEVAGDAAEADDGDGDATGDGGHAAAARSGAQVTNASAEADDADRDERRRMQMLIHVEGDRVQVSVLEGRSLVEHYVADRTSQSLAGNIYLGKVQNVLPGMEAAFVDIGTPKNAVLYAGDVRFIADEFETKTPRIEDILEVGQSVLVQVVKDPMGSKGARLTTEISLPGRFLVLVPESDTTGISRRLAESERERLRDVLRRIRPDGFGVIVRTASEYTSEEKLALDMQRLEALWKEVYLEATRANPPELVYEEPDLVIRTVREIFSGEFRRLIVDDTEVYDKICAYLGDYEPDLLQRIQHYEDEMALYRRYHVSEQLRQGLSRKVWLPSGGSLVFDSAEALTVIDVNTSKNVGKNSLEETVFQNNLEAAEEIGRQLRLRDIGGIIVIDFIDMETAKNRQAVLRAFREAVGRDKTKTQVYDISELGLVEMTRKNVSEGLISAFSHACAECSGRGLIVDEDF